MARYSSNPLPFYCASQLYAASTFPSVPTSKMAALAALERSFKMTPAAHIVPCNLLPAGFRCEHIQRCRRKHGGSNQNSGIGKRRRVTGATPAVFNAYRYALPSSGRLSFSSSGRAENRILPLPSDFSTHTSPFGVCAWLKTVVLFPVKLSSSSPPENAPPDRESSAEPCCKESQSPPAGPWRANAHPHPTALSPEASRRPSRAP